MVTIPSPFPPQTTSIFPKPPPLNYFSSSLTTLSPLKFRPNLKSKCLPSSSPLHHNDVDDYVIGDCLVFEEGAFDHPFPTSTTPIHQDDMDNNNDIHKTNKKKKKKNKGIDMEAIDRDNLVPEEWKEVQAEINITKKERRKIAQEIQFNSRVEKKKQGYLPISSVNLEEYKAYREAKLAQLNPIVLDQPANFKEEEEEGEDQGDKGSERVGPRNPRWAVYGKGFEDVKEFFQSGDYVPADNKSQGPRKLFTKEEKALLNKKVPDLTAATSNKWLPLHTLAASGEFYLMDALLKHNVDINAVDVDSLTALHKAIIGKKQAITSYLLRESANPFVLDEDGASLMHYAVQTASTPAIKLLLLYNIDINLQDKDGWTPLHLAVQARRTDIVKLLLIRGADKTIKNREGLTPLGLCLYSGRDTRTYELIKLLKQLPKKSKSLTIVPSHMVSTS